jgi:hypothetical protein
VPRAHWQIQFVTSVVNTYPCKRNGLRAVGERVLCCQIRDFEASSPSGPLTATSAGPLCPQLGIRNTGSLPRACRSIAPTAFYATTPCLSSATTWCGCTTRASHVRRQMSFAFIGLSLAYPLNYGAQIMFGSIMPMLLFNTDKIRTKEGAVATHTWVILAGVAVCLAGVVISGRAGILNRHHPSANNLRAPTPSSGASIGNSWHLRCLHPCKSRRC